MAVAECSKYHPQNMLRHLHLKFIFGIYLGNKAEREKALIKLKKLIIYNK